MLSFVVSARFIMESFTSPDKY